MPNMFELAELLVNGEISPSDKRLNEVSEALQELASTEQGLAELAEIIAIYLDENFHKFDIAPMIFESKHFKLGDRPEFRLKKKGIRAYWIAPNSSTPKSRNYQETLSMEFDSLSVRPECLIDDLKAGRVQSFAELVKDAKEALKEAIAIRIYTLLSQTYNSTSNSDLYFPSSSTLTQQALDDAIDEVVYRNGGTATVIGDYKLVKQITKFTGFTEEAKEEIRKKGVLGVYNGAKLVYLPQVKSPVTGNDIVPRNALFVVGGKIGFTATYADTKHGQETSIEDWSWNARFDKEWGATVIKPDGVALVEVV